MNRIENNAEGKPFFDLTYGQAWYNKDKKTWKFYTTHGILMQAVEEGYATVKEEKGTYGITRTWFTNDGKEIRKCYTDFNHGLDTWNPYPLENGIFNLSKEGKYDITFEDIQANVKANAPILGTKVISL